MAAKTRIKHLTSSGTAAPTILRTGEVGYSYGTGTQANKGDRFFIGIGAEDSNGIATEIVEIGGQYYTDMLNHAHGSLQADSALITNDQSKLLQLKVDNLDLNGNTISSTDTNGNIVVDPNGTGKTVLHNVYINGTSDSLAEFVYDTVGGAITAGTGITVSNDDAGNTSTVSITDITFTNGQAGTEYGSATAIPAITVNAQGQVTRLRTFNVATSLTVDGDTGTQDVDLLTDDLQILGTPDEITTAVTVDGTNIKATIGLPDDVTIGDALTVTGNASVGGNATVTGNLTVNGSTINLGNQSTDTVTISGNLVVQGTTTTVESTTITIDDPVLALADNTTSATSDGLDRGVRFKWGDGSAVKEGFFGFDIQTERFVFTKDEDFSTEENASSPWHDAQFGGVYADNVRIGVTAANEIDTSNGNLVLDSQGGTVQVDDNLNVTGTVSLSNDLAVAHGGTGLSSFTANAVFISNTSGSALSFITGSEGEIIQFDASGVPVASDVIDGGTY
jgi:hypothetical protein